MLVHTSIMTHTSVDYMNILLIRQTASTRSFISLLIRQTASTRSFNAHSL